MRRDLFGNEGGAVKMEVVSDRHILERDYPLLSGVARASWQVERHHPRVIRLHYGDPTAKPQRAPSQARVSATTPAARTSRPVV